MNDSLWSIEEDLAALGLHDCSPRRVLEKLLTRRKKVSQHTTLIVGAHFRPPAKQVLAVLAAGQLLRLAEDNENAYDPAAVRVLLDLTDSDGLPQLSEAQLAALEVELPNAGITLEQLMSTSPLFLGFVPAQDGKPLAKARGVEPDLLGNLQVRELMPKVEATLGFGLDGSPRLLLAVQE